MSLTKKIFKIFFSLFIAQLIAVGIWSYSLLSDNEHGLPPSIISSLTKIDKSILEGVALQSKIKNSLARDLIAYKILELNGVDSVRYIDSSFYNQIISSGQYVNCQNYNQVIVCTNNNSNFAVSFASLEVGGEVVGHLMLEKSLLGAKVLDQKILIYIGITIFIVFLINILSLFMLWWKFLRPETSKLIKVFESKTIDPTITIDEYSKIQNEFIEAIDKIQQSESERLKLESQISKINLANQVAHDIRSPLAALDMVVSELTSLTEERRIMIRSSVNRIKDIANSLIAKQDKNQTSNNEVGIHLTSTLIEEIVTETRNQYRNKTEIMIDFKIEHDSYGLFGVFDAGQFKRVISNILNNSVEACGQNGEIQILLSLDNGQIKISITDTGKGIPIDIIPKLMEKGYSYSKPNGSGLGLYHAKNMIESWGGSISLVSTVGKTEVTIALPKAKQPSWFIGAINLQPEMKVIILDDDSSIHHIWDERLTKFKDQLEIIHCYSAQEVYAKTKHLNIHEASILYLFDYEIAGTNETGLDLIEKMNICNNSILITSRYFEPMIQQRCMRISLKLIPKNLAGFTEIKFEIPRKINTILIDDDAITRRMWKSLAERKGVPLKIFKNVDEFEKEINHIDKDSTVYIDSNLGNDVKGEIYSKKIFDLGIQNIYLTTGHDPSDFENISWLKGVIGKSPPWS